MSHAREVNLCAECEPSVGAGREPCPRERAGPFRGAGAAPSSAASASVRRWPCGPRCVAAARRDLRDRLAVWGLAAIADAAELVLSELLTNALLHARTPRGRPVETRFERVACGVRIEVRDADGTWPVPRPSGANGESGRGLALVEAFTGGRWGVSAYEGAGKAVWAVVVGEDDTG